MKCLPELVKVQKSEIMVESLLYLVCSVRIKDKAKRKERMARFVYRIGIENLKEALLETQLCQRFKRFIHHESAKVRKHEKNGNDKISDFPNFVFA